MKMTGIIGINSLEDAQKALSELVQKEKSLEKDDGRAVAYNYVGNDPDIKKATEFMEVYAMVRPELSKPQSMMKIAAYVPMIKFRTDGQLPMKLTANGMKPVGYIDNYFNDVLGLTKADISTNEDVHMEREVMGKTYLSPEEAVSAAQDWAYDARPNLAISKQKLVSRISEAKEMMTEVVMQFTIGKKTETQDYKYN